MLYNNSIGAVGAKAIAEALKVNPVLKNLRKASTRFHTEERLDKCSSFSQEIYARRWLPDVRSHKGLSSS